MTWTARKFGTDPNPRVIEARTGQTIAILTPSGRHDNAGRALDEAKLLAAAPALRTLVDDARRFMNEEDPEACHWLARADTLLAEL
jgi:hypothetical protein